MSRMFMLQGAESGRILRTVIGKKVLAIMSYLSRDKWHVAKIQLTDLTANKLSVEGFGPGNKLRPINIQVDQPVGISFKHAYGKFVFDTTVVALEPSTDPNHRGCGGTIVLAAPDRIDVVQRRCYFRVNIPRSLNVNVTLWYRSQNGGTKSVTHETDRRLTSSNEPRIYYHGKLVDISAGGTQVMIPQQNGVDQNSSCAQRLDFKKGQYIGLRFTPMPYETPLMFNAQIRNILPAEDRGSVYLGLQIVGLEASPEGRQVLSRIAGVVQRYYQLNLSSAKQLDMRSGNPLHNLGSNTQEEPSQCL